MCVPTIHMINSYNDIRIKSNYAYYALDKPQNKMKIQKYNKTKEQNENIE